MNNRLAGIIDRRETELIIRRLEGELQLPRNPSCRNDLTFDYSKIDPIYHASLDREEELLLYKGALRGYEDKGFLSLALRRGLVDHVNEVRGVMESGDNRLIRELFDAHTSYYYHTALLSATFNPELAQVFAPTRDAEGERTIYKLKIRANRSIVDGCNIGGCGNNGELLILGAIFPEEIVEVKIGNEDLESELLTSEGIIRWFPEEGSINRDVKNPNNWRHLCD